MCGAAEEKHHAWHRAIVEAIERDWPNPVVVEGRVNAVSSAIVEGVLGTAEFIRRREEAIAQAPKGDGVDHHPSPRASGPGGLVGADHPIRLMSGSTRSPLVMSYHPGPGNKRQNRTLRRSLPSPSSSWARL